MFASNTDYPRAVASYDDDGVAAAIDWCLGHLASGDVLTVWTYLMSSLRYCEPLKRLVDQYSDVQHVAGRGGGWSRSRGPVLMAWADQADIGQLARRAGPGLTALCVISSDDAALRPWVHAANTELLGDPQQWSTPAEPLPVVVVDSLEAMTTLINHNNTISAGYEKDVVVSELLALRAAGIALDARGIQGWVVAHGWSGKNPARLRRYVEDVNAGKTPRTSWRPDPAYVRELRGRGDQRPTHAPSTTDEVSVVTPPDR